MKFNINPCWQLIPLITRPSKVNLSATVDFEFVVESAHKLDEDQVGYWVSSADVLTASVDSCERLFVRSAEGKTGTIEVKEL